MATIAETAELYKIWSDIGDQSYDFIAAHPDLLITTLPSALSEVGLLEQKYAHSLYRSFVQAFFPNACRVGLKRIETVSDLMDFAPKVIVEENGYRTREPGIGPALAAFLEHGCRRK